MSEWTLQMPLNFTNVWLSPKQIRWYIGIQDPHDIILNAYGTKLDFFVTSPQLARHQFLRDSTWTIRKKLCTKTETGFLKPTAMITVSTPLQFRSHKMLSIRYHSNEEIQEAGTLDTLQTRKKPSLPSPKTDVAINMTWKSFRKVLSVKTDIFWTLILLVN